MVYDIAIPTNNTPGGFSKPGLPHIRRQGESRGAPDGRSLVPLSPGAEAGELRRRVMSSGEQ